MSGNNRKTNVIAIVGLLLLLLAYQTYQDDSQPRSQPQQQTKVAVPNSSTIISSNSTLLPTVNIQEQPRKPTAIKKANLASKVAAGPIMLKGLSLEPVYQCENSADENLVGEIQQALSWLEDEVPLIVTNYVINELLTIKLIAPQLPSDFHARIEQKMKIISYLYHQYFQLSVSEPTTMNLVVFPSLTSYTDTLSRLSIDSSNSQGLFSSNSNFSFAAYRTLDQLEQTIIHELVHALTYHFAGFSARWLTEGLAQHFATVEYYVEDQQLYYYFKTEKAKADQASNGRVANTAEHFEQIEISTLVAQEADWQQPLQRAHLYANAQRVVSDFVEQRSERNIVRHLLHKERTHPCVKLSSSEYLNLLDQHLPYLSVSE